LKHGFEQQASLTRVLGQVGHLSTDASAKHLKAKWSAASAVSKGQAANSDEPWWHTIPPAQATDMSNIIQCADETLMKANGQYNESCKSRLKEAFRAQARPTSRGIIPCRAYPHGIPCW
jgi:hypothetical protein